MSKTRTLGGLMDDVKRARKALDGRIADTAAAIRAQTEAADSLAVAERALFGQTVTWLEPGEILVDPYDLNTEGFGVTKTGDGKARIVKVVTVHHLTNRVEEVVLAADAEFAAPTDGDRLDFGSGRFGSMTFGPAEAVADAGV